VVVADEPVSALDVSVQAAVTELLMDIQRKNKTTMLFISHDLSVVRYIADRVVVMYLGHIVEQGTTDQIFAPPYHPYTEALLSAIPIADTSVVKQHIVLEGDIPSAMNPPPGCPFQTRCRWKKFVPGNKCETQLPPLKDLGGGHMSLCWLAKRAVSKAAAEAKAKDEAATFASRVRSAGVEAKFVKAPAATRTVAKMIKKADANKPKGIRRPAKPDDLTLISGVGPVIQAKLHELNVFKFDQIAAWKKAERDWVDGFLDFKGRIEREDWVKQAKALAKGGVAEYIKVFGKKPR
jgi:peptide/nickel transport system ATP-binding protein